MSKRSASARRGIVPAIRYRDPVTMVNWLCLAFGFERQQVVTGEDGSFVQAALRFGEGVLIVGAVRGSLYDSLMVQPDEIGGLETQSCYLPVLDADSHYARAKAAGAEIVFDLEADGEGGRGYTCRDPEGHIWSFGTFDPWGCQPQAPAAATAQSRTLTALTLLLLPGLLASGLATSWMYLKSEPYPEQIATLATLQPLPSPPAEREQTARAEALQRKFEQRIGDLERELAEARRRQEAAEASLKRTEALLAGEQSARQSAERLTRELKDQVARDAAAMQAIASSARAFEGRLLQSPSTWVPTSAEATASADIAEPPETRALERALRDVRAELARERQARSAAEAALLEARREIGRRRAVTAQD
jgi:uncharacterized glyoxalase superfamily protein PhnB